MIKKMKIIIVYKIYQEKAYTQKPKKNKLNNDYNK